MAIPAAVTTIVKVTSNCNLQCSYCYDAVRCLKTPHAVMPERIVEQIVRQSLELGSDRVEFIWHGGEPLTAGISFFESVVAAQTKHMHSAQVVENDLQTNATLINEDWLGFFKEHNFKLGISIDGPEWLHNKHRIMRGGKGSHRSVMEAIESLQAKELRFGVLAVLTKDGLGYAKDLYSFFKDRGVGRFDFLPDLKSGSSSHSISPDEFATFIIELFDIWMQDDDPDIHIRYLDNVLNGFLGGQSHLCSSGSTCANFITVDVDGSVYACDVLVPNPNFKFGSITEQSLEDILDSAKRRRFVERVRTLTLDCKTCTYLSICRGDCTYNRYLAQENLNGQSIMCDARKRIFQHIESHLRGLLDTN